MEMEMLNKILLQVENMGVKLQQGQAEMKRNIEELQQGQIEMKRNIEELQQGQIEMKRNIEELQQGQKQMQTDIKNLQRGQKKLEEEIDTRFDQYTLEIANEIHEVGKMLNSKIENMTKEIKRTMRETIEMNERDHSIFRAQIERLQYITKDLAQPETKMKDIRV